MVLFTGANAGAPAFVLPSITSRGSESLVTSTALRGPRSEGYPQMHAAMTGAGAAAIAAMVAFRRQRRHAGRKVDSARRVEEIVMGKWDPEAGTANYTDPWNQRVDKVEEGENPDATWDNSKVAGPATPPTSQRFAKYTGPVYKGVPVVEGLQFPLDPEKYYPPLEPPAPGVKWGDGRAEDGNWYSEDADGKKVQYWMGWGKRKQSCAVVRLYKGNGQFKVNGKEAYSFFHYYPIWWLKAAEPICALSQKNEFDIVAKVFSGGVLGKSSGAGALRVALARALQEYNYNWRPLLNRGKFLTKDYRLPETKKIGQVSARKKKRFNRR